MGWNSILGNTRMTQEASTQTGREWWRKTRGTGRRLKVRPSEEKQAELRSAVVEGRDTGCYWAHWMLPVFVIKTSMKGLTRNSGRPIRWVKRGGDLPFYKYRNIRFKNLRKRDILLTWKSCHIWQKGRKYDKFTSSKQSFPSNFLILAMF